MRRRNPNLFVSHRIVETIQGRGRQGGTQAPFIMGTKGAHSIRRWNNNPPFFNSFTVDGSTGVIGSTFEFNVSASDFDNDVLSYSWSISGPGSPSLSLSNADRTATFTAAARGDYTITVSVSDEFETISQTKTVSVLNRAPTQNTFTINKTSGFLTDSFILTMVSNTDPDGDPVTITWSSDPPISPDDISVENPSSISSQATVTPTSAGTFEITATVADDQGGSNEYSKTFTVAVNSAPTITSLTLNKTTGNIFDSFTATVTATDPENDPLSYTWFLNGVEQVGQTRTFLTVAPSIRGSYTVRVVVSDGYNEVYEEASFNIVNRVPSLSPISISPSTTGNQDTAFTASVVASNLDSDDDLTYSWNITESPVGSSPTLVETGNTVTFDPPNGIYGNYTISVSVSDQHGGTSSTQTETITVQNRAPEIENFTVDAQNGYLTDEFTFAVTASDPDGGVLGYNWDSNVEAGAFSTSLDGREAVYRPRGDWTTGGFKGDHEITVTVTDDPDGNDPDNEQTISSTLTITISDRPPVASITRTGNLYVGEEISLSGLGSQDPDGDTLGYEWRISSAPGSSVAALSSTTNPSITFNPDQVGSYTIELIVTADGVSRSTTTTFEITQLASYPTVTITPNYYSGEGAPSFPESLTGQAFASDGNPVTGEVTWNWSLSGPVGHTAYLEPEDFDGEGNPIPGTVASVPTVTFQPGTGTTGTYIVSLFAQAGGDTGDTEEFSFEIT